MYGPDHPSLATSLNNEAVLLSDMVSCGRFVRAVEDASVLRNSQNSSTAQGKHEEALPLYKRSRDIKEKVFGPDHPEVALALNNEAELLGQLVGC